MSESKSSSADGEYLEAVKRLRQFLSDSETTDQSIFLGVSRVTVRHFLDDYQAMVTAMVRQFLSDSETTDQSIFLGVFRVTVCHGGTYISFANSRMRMGPLS